MKKELPKIRVKWVRGREPFDYTKAQIYLILGKKGSGKSALLENIGLRYPKMLDLFGSRDDEGLAWCRDSSPVDDILLVHGDNVDLNCSWDTCKVGDFSYSKMMGYEITIPSHSFFSSMSGKFVGIEKVLNSLWDRRSWEKPIYIAVREASSFLYSRIKQQGVNMKMAKHDFIYWQREMRHFGFALGIDSIRWTSVDKEMRDLADHLIIKKVGAQGLPADIRWLYKYADPLSMSRLPPHMALLLTDNASIGYLWSQCPVFHKEEGVDLLKELGITIEAGDEIEESSFQKVGDEEHAKIVRLYNERKSMGTISGIMHRSKSTVKAHIHQHNKAIEKNRVCPQCSRVKSDLAKVELHISRH